MTKTIISPNGAAVIVREATVGIGEALFTGLRAYVKASESWNGWVIPYFTRDQADLILKQAQAAPDFTARYDAEKDAYIFEGPDYEEVDVYGGYDWTMPDGTVTRLYCVGGYAWTWEIEDGAGNLWFPTEPATEEAIPTHCICGEPLPCDHINGDRARLVIQQWREPFDDEDSLSIYAYPGAEFDELADLREEFGIVEPDDAEEDIFSGEPGQIIRENVRVLVDGEHFDHKGRKFRVNITDVTEQETGR